MESKEIIKELKKLANKETLKNIERIGIDIKKAIGVNITEQRVLAKEIGINHKLAFDLWKIDIHEAKTLATMIADPNNISEVDMEVWVSEFYSWDLCDQCCKNLFEKTKYAYSKSAEWCERDQTFTKRAGFVLMARLAVSDKDRDNKIFESFLPTILKHSNDSRNFVKKSVNWALRSIGKRNSYLNKKALLLSKEILLLDNKSSQWIANNAIKELTSEAVINRINTKDKKRMVNMIKDYDNFFLPVDDLKVGKEFYENILGLPVKFDFSEQGILSHRIGKQEPSIILKDKNKFNNLKPTIWFVVDDLVKSHQDLSEKGIVFLTEPFEIKTGKAVEFEDPFGNRLGITDYSKINEI